MLALRQLPGQLGAIAPLLEKLAAGIAESPPPSGRPQSVAITPEVTPDFLRWSSSPGVQDVVTALCRTDRPQTDTPPKPAKRERQITLDVEEAEVEAPPAQARRKPPSSKAAQGTHAPFRKPSRQISELKLPIAETQSLGIRPMATDRTLPECELQRHCVQLGKKRPRNARKRFLDPGTEEDD